jgi:hypothetical protein
MRVVWAGLGFLSAAAIALALIGPGREDSALASAHVSPGTEPGAEDSGMLSWSGIIEVSIGEAYQGPWRGNDSDFRYQDAPTVSIDAVGTTGVAWVDQARKDILFQIYEPDGSARFAEPVNVSRSPRIFSWLPRVAFGRDGSREVYVLWQEIVFSGGSHGGEIFFARSMDGGRSFSAPLNLSNSPAGAGKGRLTAQLWHNGSLDLALGPDGSLYAAWTEYEGSLWVRRSTDGGASFADPLRVAGDAAQPARGPALAVGPGNVVHLAWTVGEDPAADIRLATSQDGGGSFGAPRIPLESRGHADAPKISVAGDGTLHLVYAESATGPLRRYHIRHARSTDGGRTFEEPRAISGRHPDEFESANFPALRLDGADNLYVLWDLFPDHRARPRGLGFAYSMDGGRTFSTPAPVPGTADRELGFNGSLQGLLMSKLAVNETGAIAIVNSTFEPDEVSRVRLIRGQAGGR